MGTYSFQVEETSQVYLRYKAFQALYETENTHVVISVEASQVKDTSGNVLTEGAYEWVGIGKDSLVALVGVAEIEIPIQIGWKITFSIEADE